MGLKSWWIIQLQIVNTRKHALEIYNKLKSIGEICNKLTGYNIFCLSTLFTPYYRKRRGLCFLT